MKNIFKSKWFKTRPKVIQEMVKLRPPTKKYYLKTTGKDYYYPYSYNENGTMRVTRFDHSTNKPLWQVFGIKPEELLPKYG